MKIIKKYIFKNFDIKSLKIDFRIVSKFFDNNVALGQKLQKPAKQRSYTSR
jgi:hypothetical protein